VLLDGVQVGAGAQVSGAILDKNVVVPPGARIGLDREDDLARGLTVTGLRARSRGKDQPIQL
jgi:glucose-1-phosphate adenylyltransferase